MNSVAARPRIKDVAEYAGVSPKTVSNVINNFEHVSDRTRETVKEAIEALGYRVNIAGRQLRQGRTGMITLAVPELDVAYFAELAKHVMAEADRRGQTVLLHQTNGVRERELAALHGFDAQFTDGVILSPLALHPRDVATRDRRLPVVLLGERPAEGSTDHVAIDNVAAAREATAHLLSRGRRRIAVVGGMVRGPQGTDRLRTDGYREALKEAHVPFDSDLVVPVDAFHWRDGARAAAALLDADPRPDALLCLNDHLALGALRALYERGVSVPGELDVVGFDDIEASQFSVPSLTTVAPDKREIARAAVALLLDRIDDPDTSPLQDHVVGHEVIVRESTGG
ncbi:LacI family DNA-binding transcriptional regulator [Streptomyces longispororuber]|uniref:LacI family DNA-binding transcriptional regulator n=1 Tax=Streptomyces longispororuber TaxID=68230 RepID=UPI00210885E5|nr:LacI family DNA-binding transcriptional regulator [Streptomyces longispororuber]MCQ4208043.1 LacI family transcriptional regulator [Streptomyces longispororuber]